MHILYRASDDHFVIKNGAEFVAEASAFDLAARRVIDKTAPMFRLLDFKEWQLRFAGALLCKSSVEQAIKELPRL